MTDTYTRADDHLLSRRLLEWNEEAFWAIRPTEAALELWSYRLRRQRRIELSINNVSVATRPSWPYGPDAPPAEILAIAKYGSDTLLIVTRISKKPWPKVERKLFSEGPRSSTVFLIPPDDAHRYFDTHLQLYSIAADEVILERTLSGLYFTAGHRFLQRTTRGADGETILQLVRVELLSEQQSTKRGSDENP